eukprot:CAMPEP_0173243688 /NCGR_PEP_ID=MMETSP1142-20121109/15653_1 /TAXON_ID=483371 /ORGANISM="non described non described, Strain CCMP2298" /LENGTH=67 /DNA_ID=CAMNT_0014175333 /DNA_START=170 /DNA_END=373 /DNA_ORIENTATION=-
MSKRITLTLRELRIAKLERKSNIKPCSQEIDAYLRALARFGDDNVPAFMGQAITDCMDLRVSRGAMG